MIPSLEIMERARELKCAAIYDRTGLRAQNWLLAALSPDQYSSQRRDRHSESIHRELPFL